MKIVTLSSGGIDSTLMMKMLMENNHEIHPLFINYGQLSHEKEYNSFNKICKFFDIESNIVNISTYGNFIPSGITNAQLDIYEDAFLPNRNLLFLLIGSSFAFQNEIYVVAIGLIRNPIFPDQTKKFLSLAEDCIRESLNVDMKIIAPLLDIDKNEIYALAKEYNLPISDVYYCHSGNDEPCGKCVACREHMAVLDSIQLGGV